MDSCIFKDTYQSENIITIFKRNYQSGNTVTPRDNEDLLSIFSMNLVLHHALTVHVRTTEHLAEE